MTKQWDPQSPWAKALRNWKAEDPDRTYADLATRVGMPSPSIVSRWAKGMAISDEYKPRVSDVLGISIDELITGVKAKTFIEAPKVSLSGRAEVTRCVPPAGWLNADLDKVEYSEAPKILNGAHQGEMIPASMLDDDWNPKNLVCLRVQGKFSERYRDGALVIVEKNVKPADIPDGEDVIVQVTGNDNGYRHAIRQWRTSGKDAILVDIHDANGIPVPWRKGLAIYGVVRRVYG